MNDQTKDLLLKAGPVSHNSSPQFTTFALIGLPG